MTENKTVQAQQVKKKRKKQSQFIMMMQRLSQNKTAMFGLIVFLLIVLVSVFAPLIAPYSPTEMNMKVAFATPSREHLMGCDNMGRDMFSRLLYGGRYSLALGLSSAAIGALGGIILGCISGYFGGWVDNLVMRLADIMQSIPGNLLSIVISTVLGAGVGNTILALCISGIAPASRMLRARILSERQAEYLEAAESINCSKARIMFKHLLPNTISPLIVNITMGIGAKITAAAGLSYIGLGVQPPTPEWGNMLAAGKQYITSFWPMMFWPGLMIAICLLCFNMIGDGLRDALDPRMKR